MPKRKTTAMYTNPRTSIIADVLALELGIMTKSPIPEYILQRSMLVCSEPVQNDAHFRFVPTARRRHEMREQVKKLRAIVLPEQRSDAWYEFRKKHLTASDTGTILGLNKYSTPEEVIIKKTGVDTFTSNAACEHGCKYEPITNEIYMARTGHVVHDFGCIPDEHDTFIAASPDGIRSDGRMVEYKNPYSRTITGVPGAAYYAQMQQQLKVANLECCDFVETKMCEYISVREYEADCRPGAEDCPWTADGREKGIGLATHKDGRNSYQYAPLTAAPSAAKKWLDERIAALGDLGDYDSVTPFYWHCKTYSSIEVYRDREWWAKQFPVLEAFWTKLQQALSSPEALAVISKKYNKGKGEKEKKWSRPPRSVTVSLGGTATTNDDHFFSSESDSDSDSGAATYQKSLQQQQAHKFRGKIRNSPTSSSCNNSASMRGRTKTNDDHLFSSDSESDSGSSTTPTITTTHSPRIMRGRGFKVSSTRMSR